MKKYFLLAIPFFLIACQGSENSISVPLIREAIIENHEKNAHLDLLNKTQSLDESIQLLVSNRTVDNLTSTRDKWKESAIAYSKTEVFNIGEVKNSFIHFGIYSWGALTDRIETTIADGVPDDFEINSVTANARGFTAIEYLLFAQNEEATLTAIEDESRRNYLSLLGLNLTEKTERLNELWMEQRTTFIEKDEENLRGGINQLINSINNTLSIVKKLKIGIPAGLESSGENITELQAALSETSLDLIDSNLNSIELIYFTGTPNLSEYVSSVSGNEEINQAIRASFAEASRLSDQIDTSLAKAISNQSEEVRLLHAEVDTLIRLFSADVASVLSIIITPTDADGD